MKNSQKSCKRCGKPLPYGDRHSKCEACRNKFIDNARNGVVVSVMGLAVKAAHDNKDKIIPTIARIIKH